METSRLSSRYFTAGGTPMRELTIGKNDAGQRLDRFVSKALPLLPPALLQKYIADSAALYENRTQQLPIAAIGSTIGTHAGPGAIALAFFGNT